MFKQNPDTGETVEKLVIAILLSPSPASGLANYILRLLNGQQTNAQLTSSTCLLVPNSGILK